MSEVKWIKLSVDMFDNRKIKHIRRLPKGNDMALLWIMMLAIAGKSNRNGRLCLTDEIPYSNVMLAEEIGFKTKLVIEALELFEALEMITYEDGFIKIDNWDEYQNADRLSEIREYNRQKKREQRARAKVENVKDNVKDNVGDRSQNVIECQDTDIDIDIDIEYDDLLNNKLINRLTDFEREDLEGMCRVRMCSLNDLIRNIEFKKPNGIEHPYEYLKGVLEKDENWSI